MAGRSNRIDKKIYYITMIITALILALLMVFEATREGIVGFFGWAVCVYIPALFVIGALLLSGKRPSLPKNRAFVFLTLFVLFVCTMHILLAKELISSGDSYVLAPLQGYDTVGGMFISLLTTPFKLLISNYGLLLSVFFVLTAIFGFFALYPFILTFKDNDTPKRPTARKVAKSLGEEKNKLYVKDLTAMDELPRMVEPAYSPEPLLTFAPKEPTDRRQLFASIRDENELHLEQGERSAAILFNQEEPKEKEDKPRYGALGKLADSGIRETDLYTNQGRQRLFDENIAKTFGQSHPKADYDLRYGVQGRAEYNQPSPHASMEQSGYGQHEQSGYGQHEQSGYGQHEQSGYRQQEQSMSAVNPAEYIKTPLTPSEYAPFKEIMGEDNINYQPAQTAPYIEHSQQMDYNAGQHQSVPPQTGYYHPDQTISPQAGYNHSFQTDYHHPSAGRSQPTTAAKTSYNRQPQSGHQDGTTGVRQTKTGYPQTQTIPQAMQPRVKTQPESPKGIQENLFSKGVSQPVIKKKPYVAPPLELLTNYPAGGADFPENYNEVKEKIDEIMTSAGIAAEVISARRGPSFTRYELRVEAGQSVQKVVAQSTMLKMRLLADSIRILAPIRGRDAVGIEIPNTKRDIVGLRSVIGSREFNTANGGVHIAFGKTLEGAPYIDDLARMPHMLIAGATGTGKSVFINSLITSILYKYSPCDVRLLLIDPKKVELSVYQNLPNLLIKETVKEPHHAVNLLRWLTQEMDRRYDFLEKIGCNELEFYNEKVRDKAREPKIPRIVLVIDEMADLMVKGKGQVEEYIVRLAQLGRAAGIHLVLATQRPTVNVITGLIKANILARVAFMVMTSQDSRIILDETGAEGLLGNGDLLYSYRSELERIQGAYIDIKDIKEICTFIKKHNDSNFNEELATLIKNEPQEEQVKEKTAAATERDNDFEATLKRVLKTYILENRASISNAQAKHNIGYIKAKKILDELAERGYVSSSDPSKPREVLITMEEYKRIFESEE